MTVSSVPKKTALRIGPGLLVTAAFIGPGTVTAASVAGAKFGHALLWALLLSIGATIVLQEMSARLGLVTRRGLGEALRATFVHPWLRGTVVALVVGAITFGNAAFETGNIIGAASGLNILTGVSRSVWSVIVGVTALGVLAVGAYRVLEKLLIALVALMGVTFVTTAIIVRPDFSEILVGAFVPRIPAGSLLTIVALIGTTVVPYNLFLHASLVREKWSAETPVDEALRQSRLDTTLSIALGGLVTLAVAVTAAGCFKLGTDIADPASMAEQLEPLLGSAARWFLATGLFAAGLTSAITAPLAAAYATAGVCGWQADFKSFKFRFVWAAVIVVGTVSALVGGSPIAAIVFAQAANGLILPIIAVFLLVVVNRRNLLGRYVNGLVANTFAGLVVLVTSGLGIFCIWKAIF